ncbi:MAG: sensory histidine kinase AtoS [Methanomassiliicoccales archaeon PtaU1.Bin124]|nr:MAG: sensory histidine kinase AtoS [Methanomassiliicoccales archaeon PtaU1.Bin124]
MSESVEKRGWSERPLFIVIVYLTVSAVWIGSSDTIVYMLVEDPALRTSISIVKGMVFIILSALLIYYLVARGFRSLEASKRSLSENERKIRAIFENAPHGMIEKDPSGVIVRLNVKAEEMLGAGHGELLGTRYVLPQATSTGAGERTIRLERKDGTVRWLRVITTVIRESSGSLQNLEMLSDVTGEVLSSERLRQRAEEMEALYDISRGIIESEMKIDSLDTMCRMAVERIGARSAWIYVLGEEGMRCLSCRGPRPQVTVRKVGDETRWLFGEKEVTAKRWEGDGTAIRVEMNGMDHIIAPMFEAGQVFGVMGFGHEDREWFTDERLATIQPFVNLSILAIQKVKMVDALKRYTNTLEEMVEDRTFELSAITHQLEEEVERTNAAQELLYREMEKLTVTLHSIGEGVVVIDPDGTVQMANRTAEEMVRHGSHGITGENLVDRLPLRDPKSDQLLGRYWSQDGTNGGTGGKAVLLDGVRKDLYYNSSPIRDQDGRTVGHVVVFRDITSEVQLQEAEERTQRLEAIGHLAGDLAHSFNNALTSILGNIEMLGMDMAEDDPRRTWLREGQEAAVRVMGLTNQLLTFSKGGQPIKKDIEPIALLDQAMRQFSQESRVRVELQADQELWMVEVDELQMSQALYRLLSYMASIGDQDRMKVDVRKVQSDLGGPGHIMYRVVRPLSNKGLPVPSWRGGQSENQGLDVTIAKSIVERHGGRIDFITTMDSSICEVMLPAYHPLDMNVARTAGPVKEGVRVLIMDDDPDVLEILHELLTRLGHKVEDSRDGLDAMSRFMQAYALGAPFDVLIMDLNVPGGMGGKEAVQRLNEKFDDVCAIVSSGYSNDPVMARHQEFGFVGVLPKPYTMKQLSDAVQKAYAAKCARPKKRNA